jgi:homoserine kinase
VALSGAGPSMVAFAASDEGAARVARAFQRCARELKIAGAARVVGLSARGAYARKLSQ